MIGVGQQHIEKDAPIGGRRASDVAALGVSHRYGDVVALDDVDLSVEHGELMTLLGPSGSGKSTLLRIIGGLERPTAGSIRIGGRDVTGLRPEQREVGIVFQNYALFPHMTVAENVSFPLRMRHVSRADIARRTAAILDVVGLTGMERRRPAELSGGQQQRVAVARALVFEPRVLLLDEPFGALDRRLREQLGLEVRRVQRELGITTVFVTHDQDEAFTMSTRIAVMGAGRILQIEEPGGIYRDPARLEVARYLGHLNEVAVLRTEDAGAETRVVGAEGICFSARFREPSRGEPRELLAGVRPEHIDVGFEPSDIRDVRARVRAAIFGGDSTKVELLVGHELVLLAVLHHGGARVSDGDEVWIGVEPGAGMVFDRTSGARLA